MLDVRKKTVETQYTATAAYLVGAFLFSPAILVISRPVDTLSMSLALVWSAASVTMAWFAWKRSSRFFDLSIMPGDISPATVAEAGARMQQPRMPRAV
jgi:hypothetical protein